MHPGPSRTLPTPLTLVLAALACTQIAADCEADDDDSSVEEFCITVAGVGGFDTVQAAVDAAPAGGVVTVCDGTFEEDVDIDKPITIAGASQRGSVITGGGAGTIIEIDGVDGPVVLSRLALVSPNDELGTIRGLRITGSNDVTLNEVHIEFEPESNGNSRGLVGVEASQSTVVANELSTFNIGFNSDTGGAGVFAQTGSVLEIYDSTISGSGSFGIHTLESQLTVVNSEITATNRPPTAENFDSDGSGIFVEGSGNEEIVVEGTTITNGSFVGIWMQANNLSVTASTIEDFTYGIFMQGDQGSASGRNLTVSGTSFGALRNWAILANSNASISASQIENPGQPAIQVRAPGGTISISGNTITGASIQGILAGGNTTDGRAETVEIVGNTITDVTAGNGVLILDVVDAVMSDNIVANIDHAYFRDPENPASDGSITNGYGIACFRAQSCSYSGNDISEVEFSNIVIVQAGFDIGDDFVHGSWWNGIHIEESQGTLTGTELRDNRGSAVYLSESTVVAEGVTIADVVRGPFYTDIDGEEDPLPEELVMSSGGWGVESRSGGAPAYLEWRDGTFENVAYGGIFSFRGQILIDGNTMTNVGIIDEVNTFSQGAISLSQGPEGQADPLIEITNNELFGSAGSNLVQMFNTPGAVVRNNILCGGTSGGLWISNADASVGNNRFGSSEDDRPECDDLTWAQAMRISGNDLDLIDEGSVIEDNLFDVPLVPYALRISGLGPFQVENNTVNGGTTTGIDALFSIPSQLFTDRDGDGQSPYSGDCDDDDAGINTTVTEIPDDGIDNDCNAATPDSATPSTEDLDQDGFSVAEGDCDDTDPLRAPGLTEVLGNWVDDDCDGFADTDAEDLPFPVVTLLENTVSGAGTGIVAQGATVILDEAETNPTGNRLENLTSHGVDLRSWTSQGTVAPGVAVISSSTELDTVAGDCVRLTSGDTSATVGAATFTGCGVGLSTVGVGSIAATGTVIESPTSNGVSANNGSVILDGVTINTPGASGISVSGSADVDGSNVVVTGAVAAAVVVSGGDLDLTGGSLASTAAVTVLQSSGVASLEAVDIALAQTGARVTGGILTLTGGTIDDALVEGIHGDAGTLVVDGTDIDGAVGDGIRLDAGVAASITNAVLVDNGGFGLNCDGVVTLSACTATASGNTLGDYQQINGCDVPTNAICGLPIP